MTRRRFHRRPFTLVEALATVVLVAIVVPVTMQGLAVAGRAGEVAVRTSRAARLADGLLNDLVLTEDWRETEPEGDFEEWPLYRWEFAAEEWQPEQEDSVALWLCTVTVFYPVQQRELNVSLGTLVPGGVE